MVVGVVVYFVFLLCYVVDEIGIGCCVVFDDEKGCFDFVVV